jgi:hypothetical protein
MAHTRNCEADPTQAKFNSGPKTMNGEQALKKIYRFCYATVIVLVYSNKMATTQTFCKTVGLIPSNQNST